MKKVILLTSMLAAISSAHAAVVSVTGVDVRIFNPVNVVPDVVQSNFVNVFNEQQNVRLLTGLGLNHVSSGLLNNAASAVPGTVPFGVAINSHFIQFDPVGTVSRTGSATFDARILGVIYENAAFNSSTPLVGLSGNTYGTASGAYGLEIAPNADTIGISGDRLTLNFHFNASSPADRIRVITAVPEPATLLPVLAGLAMLIRRKR